MYVLKEFVWLMVQIKDRVDATTAFENLSISKFKFQNKSIVRKYICLNSKQKIFCELSLVIMIMNIIPWKHLKNPTKYGVQFYDMLCTYFYYI